MPDPDQSPIFVVGTGRSGTTLLRMMLCAHPRIHLTHEASFYLWERNDRTLRALAERYVRSFSFRWLRLDPRPILDGLPAHARPRDLFTAVMRAAAGAHGKPRFGDKTPSHTGHLGRIFEDWPDARVIRIVRDPRDVVRSLNQMPWAPASRIAGAVLVGHERRQCARFTDRLLTVRLEDLLMEPRAQMERVLAFVGEPWDEAVLNHTRHLPGDNDLPPMPWFDSAARRPGTPTGALRIDPPEIRLIEWLTRASMRDHGYTPMVLRREPRWTEIVRCYLKDLPEFVRGGWIFARLLARTDRYPGGEDEVGRALFRTLNPHAWSRWPKFELPPTPSLPDDWQDHLPPA